MSQVGESDDTGNFAGSTLQKSILELEKWETATYQIPTQYNQSANNNRTDYACGIIYL